MRISDWSSDVCSSDLVSLSIDSGEARLQRQGYVQAFRDRQVLEAITGGILGRIAVTYFEWANSAHTHMVVTWTFIDSAAAAEAFAAALEQRRPGPADRKSTRLNSRHQCATRITPPALQTHHNQHT